MNPTQLFLQQNPGMDLQTPDGQAALQQWLNSSAGQAASAQSSQGTQGNNSLNIGSLVGAPNSNSASNGLNQAITDSLSGGNTQQLQGSQQSGAFQSSGGSSTSGIQQEQGVQQGQTSQQQQQLGATQTSGQQAQTGATSGAQQGQTTNAGQTQAVTGTSGLTQVLDQLGLGSLIQGQAGNAASGANTASGFLQGVAQGNNPLLQAQTSNAVNTALSGPGMVGTGQGAQARAAGDAAANVGLNSQGQQITAANSLGNPTAVTTLAAAANPYLGQQTSGSQATSGTSANTGTSNLTSQGTSSGLTDTSGSSLSAQDLSSLSNSLNLSSLLNSSNTQTQESQGGTSAANSTQEAIGQVPQSQTSSGSGCYVCTAYYELNPKRTFKSAITRAARYKLSHARYDTSLAGYSVYGPTLARWVLKSKHLRKYLLPVVRGILYAECRLARPDRFRSKFLASVSHAIFHYGSVPIAWAFRRKKMVTTDPETLDLLQRNGLNFHG